MTAPGCGISPDIEAVLTIMTALRHGEDPRQTSDDAVDTPPRLTLHRPVPSRHSMASSTGPTTAIAGIVTRTWTFAEPRLGRIGGLA
jgi:hypothetical protein